MLRYSIEVTNNKTGKKYQVETTHQLKTRLKTDTKDLNKVTDPVRYTNPLKEGEDVFTFKAGKKKMKLWRKGVNLP